MARRCWVCVRSANVGSGYSAVMSLLNARLLKMVRFFNLFLNESIYIYLYYHYAGRVRSYLSGRFKR